jgi:hypothetical protein
VENKVHFLLLGNKKTQIYRKHTGSKLIAPQLLSCDQNNLQIRDPHQISVGPDVFQTKSMTWKKNFSELHSRFLRFSTIFGYFGWKHELYRIFSRGSRKSGSFLRQLNGYLAIGTFRNRK